MMSFDAKKSVAELKLAMSSKSKVVKIADFNKSHNGRLKIISQLNIEFEAFLEVPKQEVNCKKLYVFLSAIGRVRPQYPIFMRSTWSNNCEGLCLYP